MWASKYWAPRYWAGRYWTHATLPPPCLSVDVAIRFRYGTGRHWGTGWKWGGGTVVDPYLPACADPCFTPRFSLGTSHGVPYAYDSGSKLLWIDAANVLRVSFGTVDEHYYLQDPGGQWWHVLVSAALATIARSMVASPDGPAGMSVLDASGNSWSFSITPSGALVRQLGSSVVYVTESLGTTPIFTEESC